MEYYIAAILNTNDGEQVIECAYMDATNNYDARTQAANRYPDSVTLRVYPCTDTADGIACGALMVARRTAVNGVLRTGGNATQMRIERETAAANARCMNGADAARIHVVISDYSADTQDYYAIAAAALSCAAADGLPLEQQYAAAYRELNAEIHRQRTATAYEVSTEFLRDGGGDLVAINTAIASIIRGGDKWTPTDGGEMDAETATRLGKAIANAMRNANPTQKRIAELLARGYSQRRIAEMTGRELATINRNIAILRGKVAVCMQGGEFEELVKQVETEQAAKRAASGGRTADGARRKKERDKATQAERARRYRERKKAQAAKTE